MLLAISLILVTSAAAHGPNCCSRVSGSCRSACEKLFYDTISDFETKQQRLLDVHNFCPHHLIAFWKCMNNTDDNFQDETSWSVCCEEAQTERCRKACVNAVSPSELQHHCRRSDELVLFSCVEKQEAGEECCGLARSPHCHEVCRRWLQEPGKISWPALTSFCTPAVHSCLSNMSKPFFLATPQKYLHCCDRASTSICKEVCRKNLKNRVNDIEIMSSLKEACGALVLYEGEMKLAQCLLQSEPAAMKKSDGSESLGLDGALLHCCSKARGGRCKTTCLKTFSNASSTYSEFERNCQNYTEEDFLQCYDEVAEPCKLGCNGLSYCHEFNNRPLDMFRACNPVADHAAQEDISRIRKTGNILFNNHKLNIKDLLTCPPEQFKALACINQIKPCERSTQTTRICYDQCIALMDKCVDRKIPIANKTAIDICRMLAPADNDTCINMSIADPQPQEFEGQLTYPCKISYCGANEICKINRSCTSPEECKMYTCDKGCKIGKENNMLIPERSYVKTPKYDKKDICHRVCQCKTGIIKHCRQSCKRQSNGSTSCKNMVHGSAWVSACNLCSCYYGEAVCSKKQCPTAPGNVSTTDMPATLPCSCAPHYLPVCAPNGATYPNQCLAECADPLTNVDGITHVQGPCSTINPCNMTVCQRQDDQCLPKPQVCLSELHNKHCSQHTCVPMKSDCSNYPEELVCDTDGITHINPCRLLSANKQLAYFGPCLANCQSTGEVCGVDGNTYNSECAAHARYISVDYEGPCSHLGTVSMVPSIKCPDVKCPPLPEPHCMAHTPAGACCPVCAGAFSILFNPKEVDRVVSGMNGQGVELFSVEAIMATLDREITIAECSLRGHLTIDCDLVVLVVANKKDASNIVREACIREAERLTRLIQRQSPRVLVPLATSILMTARLVHQPAPDPGSSPLSLPLPLLIGLLFSVNLLSYYI